MKIIAKFRKLSTKDRIVYMNVIGAFAVKGAALVVSLYTMPAYMRYFADQQVLGVWFTVLSVLSWILNFDLGIGNGLRNRLTAALTLGDRKSAKEYIASAYWMIGALVSIVLVIGCVLLPHINWNKVFNIDSSIVSVQALTDVVRFAFIGIMLQFFFRLVSSILYAMQKSALNNLIALITSILQLVFVLSAPSFTPTENLKLLSAAYILCANVPLVVATVVVFAGPLKDCCPAISAVKGDKARAVLSLGGLFFICQILYMGIANTNEFFITQYTSPTDVVEYQIYNKLFTLGSTLFVLALSPVWSAVSKAIAENDYLWLKKLNKTLLYLSGIAMIVEALIIPFSPILLRVWLGDEAVPVNYIYAAYFALFGSTMIFQSTVSTIANGMGRMKTQAICYGLGVIVKSLIIHFGISITGSWIVVVIANVVILIPYCIIQYVKMNRLIERKLNSN